MKSQEAKTSKDFLDKEIPEEGFDHILLSLILIDSVLKKL